MTRVTAYRWHSPGVKKIRWLVVPTMETFAGHGCFISAKSETCEKMLEFHLQVGPALPSLRSALREEAWSTVEGYSRVPPTGGGGRKFPWGKEQRGRGAGGS